MLGRIPPLFPPELPPAFSMGNGRMLNKEC